MYIMDKYNRSLVHFSLHKLFFGATCCFVILSSMPVEADLYFPPEMLGPELGEIAELSRFQKQGAQLPGDYPVDIYLNEKLLANRTLRFIVDSHVGRHMKKLQPLFVIRQAFRPVLA